MTGFGLVAGGLGHQAFADRTGQFPRGVRIGAGHAEPDDKAKGVHVRRLERLKARLVQSLIQDLKKMNDDFTKSFRPSTNRRCRTKPNPKFIVSHLRRHVPPCADPGVWGDVDLVGLAVEPVGDNIV